MFPWLIFMRSRKRNNQGQTSWWDEVPDAHPRLWEHKEYLVHVITVLRLVEHKGTAAKVKEAFAALVKVRKEMSPFFNFPEDETAAKKRSEKKEAQQPQQVPQGQENLCGRTGPEGLQAVPLLCCWQGVNAMGQDH
jgi:hypothetical protein